MDACQEGVRDWLVGKSYLWGCHKGDSSAKHEKTEQIWCGQNQIGFMTGLGDPKFILAFGIGLMLMKIAFYPISCIVFNEQFTMIG